MNNEQQIQKLKDSFYFDDKLFGSDFTPTQTQRFFEKYDILIHQPNTESGFSATLFYDKEKDRFVAGFRGTECRF
ncbi:hypothetical protein [Helicobacter pullorum]|uniref:hypothetical protein n=1 Tax=Helicobacter pullorum TaxID=35818 RepID=UPI000816A2BA|nr:hypothetical protein [Helicobacter pullorum]OCR07400.1 hypothetical protein A7X13_08665 [Helicobacter pullorum]